MKSFDSPHLKALKSRKPPGYLIEVTFVTVVLLTAKCYSIDAYAAISFVTVLLPFMLYHILNLCGYVLEFVTSLHLEAD